MGRSRSRSRSPRRDRERLRRSRSRSRDRERRRDPVERGVERDRGTERDRFDRDRMNRERERSDRERVERERVTDREGGFRDRGGGRRRSRSPSPRRHPRGRSPQDRRRSRSSSEEDDYKGNRVDSHRKPLDDEDLKGKTEEEMDMMKTMGFCAFDTTKEKKVQSNDTYVAHISRKRRYRQYMNRRGGFNRPLDFIA